MLLSCSGFAFYFFISQTLTLLTLDRMDPSLRGSSNETGPSSSVTGEAVTGLVGAAVDKVFSGVELGESGLKLGGSSLKPGLFGDGSIAVGERARLA